MPSVKTVAEAEIGLAGEDWFTQAEYEKVGFGRWRLAEKKERATGWFGWGGGGIRDVSRSGKVWY